MKQLENIYQKLEVMGVRLALEKEKLELLLKPEKLFLRDGRERKRKIRSVNEILLHFWNGVEILSDDECWNWKRASNNRNKWNYGIIWIHMKKYKCHRFSYLISKGEIGDLLVCHKCDNPSCCNPNHLFLGTYKENVSDCINKGRLTREIGEDRYCSKLTVENVLDIKRNYKFKTVPASHFARKYNVSNRAVWNILTRLRWKHVLI